MKQLFLIVALAINFCAYSQDDKTVTLVVTGQGKTIDEAKANALRGAIEQAFGAFISSNTTILNDKLVKDEIVSVTNGSIQKYDIVNETILSDGIFATTLKAIVSVNKLTTFIEGKGIKVEFKGGLFAYNIAMQELNDKNEIVAWENIKLVINQLMKSGFDYKMEVSQPVKIPDNNDRRNGPIRNNEFGIEINVDVNMNDNYTNAIRLLLNFCKSISLNEIGAKEYIAVDKDVYPITFPTRQINQSDLKNDFSLNKKFKSETYLFRNRNVANEILLTPWRMANQSIFNLKILNGIDTTKMEKLININALTVTMDESIFKGFVLTGDLKRYWQLIRWTTDGGGRTRSVNIGNDRFNILFKDEIFEIKTLDKPFSGIRWSNPLEIQPIANFIGMKQFLHLHFVDRRNINEIKNITEYKIQGN